MCSLDCVLKAVVVTRPTTFAEHVGLSHQNEDLDWFLASPALCGRWRGWKRRFWLRRRCWGGRLWGSWRPWRPWRWRRRWVRRGWRCWRGWSWFDTWWDARSLDTRARFASACHFLFCFEPARSSVVHACSTAWPVGAERAAVRLRGCRLAITRPTAVVALRSERAVCRN